MFMAKLSFYSSNVSTSRVPSENCFLNSLTCYKFLRTSGSLTEYSVNTFIEYLLSTGEAALCWKDKVREAWPWPGVPRAGSSVRGIRPPSFFLFPFSDQVYSVVSLASARRALAPSPL